MITVTLPTNRLQKGSVCTDILGPFECYGKSDDTAATAAHNPTRDPTKPYGDTPVGEYTGVVGHIAVSPANLRSYGAIDGTGLIPVVWLTPVGCPNDTQVCSRQDCENKAAGHVVDMGLAIHSGALNGAGGMRPTHGCVRMLDRDKLTLIATLPTGNFSVSIREEVVPDDSAG